MVLISTPVDEGPNRRSKVAARSNDGSLSATIRGVLLTDLWRGPLHAYSRTGDRLGHIDFGMLIPPIRAFVYCSLLPYLCYPVALVSLYGFYRCLRTLVLPSHYKRSLYTKHVMYGVQKRVYDPQRRRLFETQVTDPDEIKHALEVTDGARNTFVDDPSAKGTAFHVVEQKIMKAEAVFGGENWAWALVSDSCRYLVPVTFAYLFHPSCKRLTVDIGLLMQRRLYWGQVRHPLHNFFKSYAEYNKAMQRINVTKPAPKGAKPWSSNL